MTVTLLDGRASCDTGQSRSDGRDRAALDSDLHFGFLGLCDPITPPGRITHAIGLYFDFRRAYGAYIPYCTFMEDIQRYEIYTRVHFRSHLALHCIYVRCAQKCLRTIKKVARFRCSPSDLQTTCEGESKSRPYPGRTPEPIERKDVSRKLVRIVR